MLGSARNLIKRGNHIARRTPAALQRVREIAPKVYRFVRGTEANREEVLREYLDWILKMVAEIEIGRAEGAAKGFACTLLGEDFEFSPRLASIDHFGVLQDLFYPQFTRLDYTKLTLQAILRLKQLYPGLGLGSKIDSVSFKGNALTGLEVAQAFTILTNSAHLFGTFATERGVLLRLRDSPESQRELRNEIPMEFRSYADDVLAKGRLHKFHYLLAVRLARSIEIKPLRKTCLALLKEILIGNRRNLGWTLRIARQVSYNRLHSLAQIDCSLSSAQYLRLLQQARLAPRIGFIDEQHERSPALALLNDIDTYQTRSFFAGPEVASLVVQHVDELSAWWIERTKQAGSSLGSLLTELHAKPAGWPESERTELSHFARIRIPSGRDWVGETRSIQQTKNAWKQASLLITPLPRDESPLLDVFSPSPIPSTTAHLLASRLAKYTAASWVNPEAKWVPEVWQSNVEFALAVLQETIRTDCRLELAPTLTSDPKRVGFGMFCEELEAAQSRLRGFRSLVEEISRSAELEGLETVLQLFGAPPPGAALFVAMGNVVLVSSTTNQPKAEVDGLFAHFTPGGVDWFFYEHKKTKDAGLARKQLRNLSMQLSFEAAEVWEGRPETGGGGVLWAGRSHQP